MPFETPLWIALQVKPTNRKSVPTAVIPATIIPTATDRRPALNFVIEGAPKGSTADAIASSSAAPITAAPRRIAPIRERADQRRPGWEADGKHVGCDRAVRQRTEG